MTSAVASQLIEEYEKQAAAHFKSAFELLTRRNALVPISSLPTELLCKVFQLCVNARHGVPCPNPGAYPQHKISHLSLWDTKYWIMLQLSHVSSTWRELVLNTMVLWSRIDVADLMDAEYRLGAGYLPFPKSLPLAITFNMRPGVLASFGDDEDDYGDGREEASLDGSVRPQKDFFTETGRFFMQRILPSKSYVTELTLRLPPSTILDLFMTFSSTTETTFSSLLYLEMSFVEVPNALDPRNFWDVESSLANMGPISFPSLRTIKVLHWGRTPETALSFLSKMDAPNATCLLVLDIDPSSFCDYLSKLNPPQDALHTTYCLDYAPFDMTMLSPHDLHGSLTSTPALGLLRPNLNTFDVTVSMLSAVSALTTFRASLVTELRIAPQDLFQYGYDEAFYSPRITLENDIELAAYKKEYDEWTDPPQSPSGNPFVDRFLIEWRELLDGLPALESLQLTNLTTLEMVYHRPSFAMPLLLEISPKTTWGDDTAGPTIRAKHLRKLRLTFELTALHKLLINQPKNEANTTPDNFLSWIDAGLSSRREHGIPITELVVEIPWASDTVFLGKTNNDHRAFFAENLSGIFEREVKRVRELVGEGGRVVVRY